MTTAVPRPLLAARQPLLIAGVWGLLREAGIAGPPRIVAPEELDQALTATECCLVILDGQALADGARLRELRLAAPRSFFVLWTAHPTADLLQAAVESGVHGLLSAGLPLEEAARALRRICRGERVLRFDADPGPLELPRPLPLSSRERQVLFLLAEGAGNADIAAALNATASSVKVCLSRMFRKTGLRNRQELSLLGRSAVPPAVPPRRPPARAPRFDAEWMLDAGEAQRREV
jgi:DNA-binding NarL/FixJ family response regulator